MGVVELIGEVVAAAQEIVTITMYDAEGNPVEVSKPDVKYIFGNAQYVKDRLEELSVSSTSLKFPLVVLFTPVTEDKTNPDYETEASLSMLIACSSTDSREWTNEVRLERSFVSVLRPIYEALFEAFLNDGRFDFDYDQGVPHKMRENYSYGRYGAYTESGDAVSDPIDAIDIRDLKIKVYKTNNCTRI